MDHILALYDQDPTYTARFSRYLQHRPEVPYTVYTFQDFDSLRRFSDRNQIELLLHGDERHPEQASLIHAKDVIQLSSGTEPVANAGSRCLYKYQSGDALLKEILGSYTTARQPRSSGMTSGRRAQLYVIFSPIGRCGKTSFALALSQALAKSRKVLYLSLEESSELSDLLGGIPVEASTLSELFYYFKEKHLDRQTVHDALLERNSVFYLPPVRLPEDLSVLSEQDIGRFLDSLRDLAEVDSIILDTDCIQSRVLSVLPDASRIFVPVTTTDSVGLSGKLGRFETLLRSSPRFRDAAGKLIKLLVPETPLTEALVSPRLLQFSAAVVRNYLEPDETPSVNYLTPSRS